MITISDKLRSLMFKETDTSFIFKRVESGLKGGDEPFNFSVMFKNRNLIVSINNIRFEETKLGKRFIKSLDTKNLDDIDFNLIETFQNVFVFESKTNKKIQSLYFRHNGGGEGFWLFREEKLHKNKPHCETGPAVFEYDKQGELIKSLFCIEGEDLTTKYNINNTTDLQNHLILK